MGQRQAEIKKIRGLAKRVAGTSEMINVARNFIGAQQKLLNEALEERALATKELLNELDRLDVLQQGNFGWQTRTVSFLADLMRGQMTIGGEIDDD